MFYNFSPVELARIDSKIQAIITNLGKRFPSMLERIDRDDLFQEGRIAFLQAVKAYKTDGERFGFVKYALIVYQRPQVRYAQNRTSIEDVLGVVEFKSRYIVSILDLLKDLSSKLRRIVLKVLNAIPLTGKDRVYLHRHKHQIQRVWMPYYLQLRMRE